MRNLTGKQESMSNLLFEPDEDASKNGCDGNDFVASENIQVSHVFNLKIISFINRNIFELVHV